MTAISVFKGLAQDSTLIDLRPSAYEGLLQPGYVSGGGGEQPGMPSPTFTYFHDDFSDGKLHGWRPTHVGADIPDSPVSVETEYPLPGLFMATGKTPYRANALANSVATFKGVSGRFPTSGIISFAGLIAVQSGGPNAPAWGSWGLFMDIENWTESVRASPQFQALPGSGTNPPQWAITDDSGTAHNITGLTNPVTGSTVSSTQWLTAGENQGKWDINYVRASFDLGNLFSVGALPTTAQYYELNINGYRFDLRGQGAGRGSGSPQLGAPVLVQSFRGGLNFGVTLARSTAAGTVYPARMVAGDLIGTYHSEGWLQ